MNFFGIYAYIEIYTYVHLELHFHSEKKLIYFFLSLHICTIDFFPRFSGTIIGLVLVDEVNEVPKSWGVNALLVVLANKPGDLNLLDYVTLKGQLESTNTNTCRSWKGDEKRIKSTVCQKTESNSPSSFLCWMKKMGSRGSSSMPEQY